MKAYPWWALCLTLLLAACEKHPIDSDVMLSGQLVQETKGRANGNPRGAHVQIYPRKIFDDICREITNQAEERESQALDGVQKERERIEQKLRNDQMEKEQTESARKAVTGMLTSRDCVMPLDAFREQMWSFADKLDAVEKAMEEDSRMLKRLEDQEHEARQLAEHDKAASAIAAALPKPLLETNTDANGKFQVRLKTDEDYVVLTKRSCEGARNVEVYQTNVRASGGAAPSVLALALYNWSTDAK